MLWGNWNTGTNNFVKVVLFNLSYLIYLYIACSLNLTAKGKRKEEKMCFLLPLWLEELGGLNGGKENFN